MSFIKNYIKHKESIDSAKKLVWDHDAYTNKEVVEIFLTRDVKAIVELIEDKSIWRMYSALGYSLPPDTPIEVVTEHVKRHLEFLDAVRRK